ncbi:unnamed protein product [Plutella xylostella]|uniref:(diamondback moth) hypothetical protein n=1 Tax=Plutella xylostella TaxID=51655 RepID=A0A8S4DPI0_PLUXY|nr:unnamed protein product [Plutella xylostella]
MATTSSEKRFQQLTLAIQKAINSVETPVKEKHVRSTIIGTFQEQSAVTYWMVAIRLPLQDNRIVAWKFCHVTHKVLREGHPACLDDSRRHTGMIENLGKLWVHLREGYGRLVHLYCQLLVTKIQFHARNPRFPPSLSLTAEELDAIAENDVNNYFQLCVELFDYMDDILNLQAAVFDSLGNARANSMTASGQCRLAALIPCAQDSSQIYDCNVRILFRLHASLPADTLSGHRERFGQQFKKLSSFYKHASSLQYYRNLLSLPVLPSNPPNFLLQSDFGTYVAPVVSIPEPSPEEQDVIGSLIDTSDTMSQMSSPDQVDTFERPSPSPQPDPVLERDRLIDHLQGELRRMRSEVQQLMQERNSAAAAMRDHCSRLEGQLHSTKTELQQEKQKAELISAQTPEIKQKLTETEEKAKLTDEKFQKLKGAYTQLREEHISLIRQKAEVDKLSASLRAAAAEHESAKMALQQQLNDKVKDVELLQQSASSSEEVQAYKNELTSLRAELELSRQKDVQLETLRASMETLEIEHKTAATEAQEKINNITSELKDVKENFENIKKEKEDRETELSRVKEELVGLREKSGEEYTKAVEEKEAALKQIEVLKEQFQQEKQEHERRVTDLQSDLETLQLKLNNVETHFAPEHEKHLGEITEQNKQIDGILAEKDADLKAALLKLADIETEFDNCRMKQDNETQVLIDKIKLLQSEVDNLTESREESTTSIKKLKEEYNVIKENLSIEIENKNKLQSEVEKNLNELQKLNNDHATAYSEMEQKMNAIVSELNEDITGKESDIIALKSNISEISDANLKQKYELESLTNTISGLQADIDIRDTKIQELNDKIVVISSDVDNQRSELEVQIKQYQVDITNLQEKLKDKQEIINDLKKAQAEKDDKIIAISVEAKTLANDVAKLEDDLNERNAELEIANNELLNLKEEHYAIVSNNDVNVTMKNDELRNLHEQVKKLTEQQTKCLSDKESILSELADYKEVSETKVLKLKEELIHLKSEYENTKAGKEDLELRLNEEIERLTAEYKQIKYDKENQFEELTKKINEINNAFTEALKQKEIALANEEKQMNDLKEQLSELEKSYINEKQELKNLLLNKDQEMQLLETRLGHVEAEKLSAECELQDLLQGSTALEERVGELTRQLVDAQAEVVRQRLAIVSSAGSAAHQMASTALSSLDGGSTRDASRAAAALAATAFEDLARHKEVTESPQSVARAAVVAAHSTARLATYVTDVANVATDMAVSDKLTSECRSLLNATVQCMESLSSGASSDQSGDLSGLVREMLVAAVSADRSVDGSRSVDDELADMDTAIEDAARQIEEMLAASRKGDSGVKLEVNSKILDACTTLMAAVKV